MLEFLIETHLGVGNWLLSKSYKHLLLYYWLQSSLPRNMQPCTTIFLPQPSLLTNLRKTWVQQIQLIVYSFLLIAQVWLSDCYNDKSSIRCTSLTDLFWAAHGDEKGGKIYKMLLLFFLGGGVQWFISGGVNCNIFCNILQYIFQRGYQ